MTARLAHKLAIANPHISADVIEIGEFPYLMQRYNIRAVPKVVINDRVEFEGAMSESIFVRQVLAAIEPAPRSGGS